jgi:hypothetical protein
LGECNPHYSCIAKVCFEQSCQNIREILLGHFYLLSFVKPFDLATCVQPDPVSLFLKSFNTPSVEQLSLIAPWEDHDLEPHVAPNSYNCIRHTSKNNYKQNQKQPI